MRRFLILAAAFAFASAAHAATVNVDVKNFAYDPPTVTINVGDTVRFNFVTSNHDVVSVTQANWNTCTKTDANLFPKLTATGNRTFNSSGTFFYICTITTHCQLGMKGQIIVNNPTPSLTPSISPTPSATPTASLTPSISPTPTASLTPTPFPPTIVVNPIAQKVKAGQNVSFNAVAIGEGQIFYTWFRDTTELFQFNPQLDLSAVDGGDAGTYRCDASNGGGTTPSSGALLTILGSGEPNDASFSGESVPGQVPAGAGLFVGVTMINTSNLTWSQSQGYTLNAVSDPSGVFASNTSIPIPPGIVVPSNGGVFQFVAFAQAPVALGPQSVQLRMSDAATGLFGATATINFDVISLPNAAEDWEVYS